MDNNHSFEHNIKINIIRELGHDLRPDSVIMDLGCGSGKLVQELRESGHQAYGCGTRFITEKNVATEAMMNKGIIRAIDLENYRLPFEDNTFDFIFSHSVFEHVQNYEETISEIARVLKPDGFSLHFFASRYRLIEPHVFVPLSTVIQSYWWLHFWVLLGIKDECKDKQTVKDRSLRFYDYLREETNYLTKKQLRNFFAGQFKDVVFCENLVNKYSPHRGKYLFELSKVIPFIPNLYSAFHTRVIFTRSPLKKVKSNPDRK